MKPDHHLFASRRKLLTTAAAATAGVCATGQFGRPGSALAQRTQGAAAIFTNSLNMEFVTIPAGTFMMGLPDSDNQARAFEKPQHQVTISRALPDRSARGDVGAVAGGIG
ncbi:hypothetical protein [Caballeronia sp. GAWG2-1]|uniref:hypothetical protein n=1 Tax=Caballeronia sp. GAWG2-1 TaxID=2921744 RepID=UPI00202969D4|nr:hypothetical protein [Caballeronia sp. GAWG2-1]